MPSRAPRDRSLIGAVAIALVVTAVCLVPAGTAVELDRTTLPADGSAVARVRAHRTNVFGARTLGAPPAVEIERAAGVEILPAYDGSTVIRAGRQSGTVTIVAGEARAELRLVASTTDDDSDGLPDTAELLSEEDRAAFTGWFTAIAEAQATAVDDAWPKVHQDCAGLIRFAYREALRAHDAAWLARRKHPLSIGERDVAAFHYPDLPIIGDLPFRKVGGPFDPRLPIREQFTAAAGARTLWEHNTRLISRRLEDARAGDLLFFSVPFDTGSRMHSMILLGERPAGRSTTPRAGSSITPAETRSVWSHSRRCWPIPIRAGIRSPTTPAFSASTASSSCFTRLERP